MDWKTYFLNLNITCILVLRRFYHSFVPKLFSLSKTDNFDFFLPFFIFLIYEDIRIKLVTKKYNSTRNLIFYRFNSYFYE